MTRFVAFLRAINVGGHVVRMDELRKVFVRLGFSGVETFIASGNVVFESRSGSAKRLEQTIAAALEAALGYEVATFIRTDRELAAVAAYDPFPRAKPAEIGSLNVAFLADAIDTASAGKIRALATEIDTFHMSGRELYWWCRKKQSESTFSNLVLERAIGRKATFRGVKTIRKMAARYCLPAQNAK